MRACRLRSEGATACVRGFVVFLPLARLAPRWQLSADCGAGIGREGQSEWAALVGEYADGNGRRRIPAGWPDPSFQIGSWLWVAWWALPAHWGPFCLGCPLPRQPSWPEGALCAGWWWVLADWVGL